MSAYRKLNSQKRQFVDLIVQRTLPTDAIRKIRPHLKRPDVLASKWKALPEVQQAIDERLEEAMEEAGITNAQILLGLAQVADFDIRKLFDEHGNTKPVHLLDDQTARVVQSVEVRQIKSGRGKDGSTVLRTKYRLPPRIEARKLLGQYKKLFTEKVDVTPVGPLRIEVVKFAGDQDSSS